MEERKSILNWDCFHICKNSSDFHQTSLKKCKLISTNQFIIPIEGMQKLDESSKLEQELNFFTDLNNLSILYHILKNDMKK
jgi:hypothetical protein